MTEKKRHKVSWLWRVRKKLWGVQSVTDEIREDFGADAVDKMRARAKVNTKQRDKTVKQHKSFMAKLRLLFTANKQDKTGELWKQIWRDIRTVPANAVMMAKSKVKKVKRRRQDAAEAKKLLRRSDLMDVLIKEVQSSVAGARDTIQTLILFMAGRLVKGSRAASYNLIVHGKTGEGKDAIVRQVGKLLPPELFVSRSSISPTALKHWLKERKNWSWRTKVLYVEDLPQSTLNSDEFKIIAGTEEETATVTDKMQVARDIKRGDKPVILLTMADIYLKDQSVRRYAIVHVDKREGRDILFKMAREREYGGVHHVSQQGKLIQYAMSKLKHVQVKIPYNRKLAASFPKGRKHRTLFGRFLDLIAASAALHQKRRSKKHGKVIANKDDYNYALEAVYKILDADKHGYSDTQQDILKSMARKNTDKRFNEGEFTVSQLAAVCGMTDRSMRDNLAALQKRGAIKRHLHREQLSHRPFAVWSLAATKTATLPTWHDLTT